MAHTLLLIAVTATLSAAVTWLVAWWLFRTRIQPRLDARLLEMQDEFERRVQAGVGAAGKELLPEFRKQVALGFGDAMRESATAGLVEDSAKIVSRSAELFEDGIKSLFGAGGPRKPR